MQLPKNRLAPDLEHPTVIKNKSKSRIRSPIPPPLGNSKNPSKILGLQFYHRQVREEDRRIGGACGGQGEECEGGGRGASEGG